VILTQKVKINLDLVELKNCPSSASPESYWYNCIVEETELSDYFKSSATKNWAIWLMVFFIMGYFLTTALQDDEMDMYFHKEEVWSLHPVYSVRHHVSDWFTKNQRMAILFMQICVMSTYLALFTRYFHDENLGLRLTVFPFSSAFVGILVAYISGYLLDRYYGTYRTFCDEKSSTQDSIE